MEQDKQMMDFIAHLQQLCLQASSAASPIGYNTFIAHLHAGLPSDFNATQNTIASYLKSHETMDTNTVDHICAILLDHEVVLENLHLVDSSALWTNPSSGCSNQNRHDHSLSSSLSHAPKPQLQQQPQHNYSAQIPQHNGTQQGTATHSKNMDQLCTFHQAPGHTIHNCNAAKAAKNWETTSNKGRDTGKLNGRCCQGCKNKAHLATVSVITAPSETAHAVSSTSSNSITNVASTSAAANAQ